MTLKDQQGQLVLGCLLAIILIGAPIFLVCGSAIAFWRGNKLQAQLDHPEVHFLHQQMTSNKDFEINTAVPSKIIPGTATWINVWIVSQPMITATQNFNISTYVGPPMFVTGTYTISITSRSDEYLTHESLGKFDYQVMDLDTEESSVELILKIEADILSDPETVVLSIPIDSDIARHRIVAERYWHILGMVIGALIPIVVGYIYK